MLIGDQKRSMAAWLVPEPWAGRWQRLGHRIVREAETSDGTCTEPTPLEATRAVYAAGVELLELGVAAVVAEVLSGAPGEPSPVHGRGQRRRPR